MHHVLILDPGIASRQINGTIYAPLKDGLKDDIFIKNTTGQPLEGKVSNFFYIFICSHYCNKFLITSSIYTYKPILF